MQSIEGETIEQFRKTEKWQNLVKAVNQCYQKAVKDPEIIGVYAARMDDQTLQRQIEILEICTESLATDDIKKKAGFFTAHLLEYYAKDKSCKEVIKHYFSVFFNFKITSKVKKLFIKSVANFKIAWREELGMLFENALMVTMQMVEKLQIQGKEGIHYEALSVDNLETIFTLQINWPQQRIEVYSSLIVLGNFLIQHIEDEEQIYAVELANILRRLTQLILKDEFLQNQTKIIGELLDLWIELIIQDFVICKDDERQKERKIYNVLCQIASWQDLYEAMVRTLEIYSPSTYNQDLDQEIYSYLKLQQPLECQIYYILKQKVFIGNIQLNQVLTNLISNTKQKVGLRYSKRVIWSIIQSLQQLVGQKHLLDLQQQKTCLQMLELFSVVLFTGLEINVEQIKHLLEHILIPLFESYLDDIWGLYRENPQLFAQRIEDCCQVQEQKLMTSLIAKAIESLADYNAQSLDIIFDYVIQSIQANKAHTVSFGSQSQFPQRKMKNTTGFLLLSMLVSNTQKVYENIESLKEIFVVQYIALLSEIEVALIYEYFSYSELDYFADQEIVGQLIDSTLVDDMSPSLRMFAISLLKNINLGHFTQNQMFQFLNLYDRLENKSTLNVVLHRLITKRLQMFTPECFLKIIDSNINTLDRQLTSINYGFQNRLKYSANQAFNCIKICEHIAKQQSILCQEQILQKLWILVQNVQKVKYISFDDELVKIGSYLLDNTKRLPQNLLLIEKVIQSFKKSQYNSSYYFQFFYKVYQNCNEQTLQLACTIQNIITEVTSVFIYHPDLSQISIQNLISINDSLWVTHSILEEKLGLHLAFLKDVQTNLQGFSRLIEELPLPSALIVRFINLKLAYTQKSREISQPRQQQDFGAFNYEWIKDLANRKKIYGYQSKLLVYTLTNLLPDIKCAGQPTIWVIMIYLLRTDVQRRRNYQKGKKIEDQDKKFLKLLSLIVPSFILERTLGQQVLIFMDSFKGKDSFNYFDSLNKLTSENQEELNAYLKREVNQRTILKVTQIKINAVQQALPDFNEEFQNTKSILRTCDKDDNDFYSLRKRMNNLMPFQKMQTSDNSGDEEEISLFTHGQKPLKKMCLDKSEIIDLRLHKKFELTETKKDLQRQKSMRKRKSRDFQFD